jgi:predicted nucleic acid-binding protein
MPAVVVDTDVVSFLFKKDTRARLYRQYLRGQDLVISFMTVAELDHWAARFKWGLARRQALERFLQSFSVVYVDRPLCRLWADVTDRAQRKGRPIDVADAWIATTALALNVPLVTHNPDDYAAIPNLTVQSAVT